MRAPWVIALAVVTGCGFHISGSGEPAVADANPTIDSGMDAEIDAMVDPEIDAPIDSPPMLECPVSYITVGNETSKYKLHATGRTFVGQHNTCVAEGTHLAVIDTIEEAAALRQLVDATSGLPTSSFGPFVFIGSAQLDGQPMTSAGRSMGWISATGPFTSAPFWENGEPNDISGVENGDEQFAAIWRDHDLLVDLAGNGSFAGLCECDGKPITVEFLALMN